VPHWTSKNLAHRARCNINYHILYTYHKLHISSVLWQITIFIFVVTLLIVTAIHFKISKSLQITDLLIHYSQQSSYSTSFSCLTVYSQLAICTHTVVYMKMQQISAKIGMVVDQNIGTVDDSLAALSALLKLPEKCYKFTV